MPKRSAALEALSAPDGRVLTESQVAAREGAQHEKEVRGEFESECPGYCGAQDTFHVGTLKGVATFTARPSTSVTAYQTTTGFIRHLCVADAQLNPTAPANCSPIAPILPRLLIAVATLVTFWASQATPAPLWIVSGMCLSLLAVPIAEDHQFVALAIPLFLLPTAVPEQRWWLLIVGALFLLPERYTWERFTSGWSSLFAYPRLYATWMLWALTIATMRRHRTIAMAPSDQGRLTS